LKTIFALAIVAAVASSVNPALSATSNKLAVTAAFEPAPPKQGPETIVVTVKEATGKPVKGAKVTMSSNMPTMSMSGPTLKAKDNGDGTYTASTKINFATKWTFDVTASAPGSQKGSTQLAADVK